MSFMRQVREGLAGIAAIVGLMLIAAVVGGYILVQQRFPRPDVERYTVQAEFSSAQAVTPGQGQKVTVAGVSVGEVSDVRLRDGRAVISLSIREEDLPWVGRDARMLLRPASALQDQSVDLDPGTERAGRLDEDDLLPVAQTVPNVNLDEVLRGLDVDTRDYLRLLVQAGADGLEGRSAQLRRFFAAGTPVLSQTRAVTRALASRRTELARLVHNLDELSGTVAGRSGDLQTLVSAGNATFGALAAEDAALKRSLQQLPGTLASADRALRRVRPLARQLPVTLDALAPALKTAPGTLRRVSQLAQTGTPATKELRGLVRAAQPLVADLRPAVRRLSQAAPPLTRTTAVVERLANELTHVPGGRHHSYLFWLAWLGHNGASMLSTQDANGPWWRGQLIFSCSNANQIPNVAPLLAPIVASGVCPETP